MRSSRGGGFKRAVEEAAECLWNQIPAGCRDDPVKALNEMQIAMAWFCVPYGRGSKVPGAAYDLLARRLAAMQAPGCSAPDGPAAVVGED
jgi:hypothetical protein